MTVIFLVAVTLTVPLEESVGATTTLLIVTSAPPKSSTLSAFTAVPFIARLAAALAIKEVTGSLMETSPGTDPKDESVRDTLPPVDFK
ncbi:MAG: hypothetical protein EBS01_06970 [Verrucomicrobia bacterium]|nr:hypothetical protein [Verrucomicrobiota bacterium]